MIYSASPELQFDFQCRLTRSRNKENSKKLKSGITPKKAKNLKSKRYNFEIFSYGYLC